MAFKVVKRVLTSSQFDNSMSIRVAKNPDTGQPFKLMDGNIVYLDSNGQVTPIRNSTVAKDCYYVVKQGNAMFVRDGVSQNALFGEYKLITGRGVDTMLCNRVVIYLQKEIVIKVVSKDPLVYGAPLSLGNIDQVTNLNRADIVTNTGDKYMCILCPYTDTDFSIKDPSVSDVGHLSWVVTHPYMIV
jgi:hypothetical protein